MAGSARARSRSPKGLVRHAAITLRELARPFGIDVRSLANKIDEANAVAWYRNAEEGVPGHVNCGLSGRRGVHDQRRSGFLSIGVCKTRGQIGVALSPFNLVVPHEMLVFATSDGRPEGAPLVVKECPLELVWQAAKAKHSELDANSCPTVQYFKRRAAIYSVGVPRRRYIPSRDIGGAIFGWSNQPALEWVASRKYYAMAYAAAVSTTPTYQFLVALRTAGWNLLLGGPDGYPLGAAVESVDVEPGLAEPYAADVSAAYLSRRRQFGHERVLVSMLLGHSPWFEQPSFWPTPRP